MYKYVLKRKITIRKYKDTVFEGTNLDKTVVLPKGTIVEFLPFSFYNLASKLYQEDTTQCDTSNQTMSAYLIATFVRFDMYNTQLKKFHAVAQNCNTQILYNEKVHYQNLAEFIRDYKLKVIKVKY